jgi:hypothetical protein
MAATENGKKYVIGKGKLFFDKFLAGAKLGTGERYLGNSPELSSNQSQDTLDHIDADQGLNVKDEQITISNDLGGAFALDSIDVQNVAMWFGGDIESSTVAAATAITENFDKTQWTPGGWKQLGVAVDQPQGTRMVTNVTISTSVPGATQADPAVVTPLTTQQLEDNFEIDLEAARIYMEPTSTLISAANTTLVVKYDQEAMTNEIIIGKGQEIRGALRFQAKNPKGENKDYFWPYVKITANGDYALKGDTWQQMSFNYEVLKKDDTTERVYITNRPATA